MGGDAATVNAVGIGVNTNFLRVGNFSFPDLFAEVTTTAGGVSTFYIDGTGMTANFGANITSGSFATETMYWADGLGGQSPAVTLNVATGTTSMSNNAAFGGGCWASPCELGNVFLGNPDFEIRSRWTGNTVDSAMEIDWMTLTVNVRLHWAYWMDQHLASGSGLTAVTILSSGIHKDTAIELYNPVDFSSVPVNIGPGPGGFELEIQFDVDLLAPGVCYAIAATFPDTYSTSLGYVVNDDGCAALSGCNGAGTCTTYCWDTDVQFCQCDSGWTGDDCSIPDLPMNFYQEELDFENGPGVLVGPAISVDFANRRAYHYGGLDSFGFTSASLYAYHYDKWEWAWEGYYEDGSVGSEPLSRSRSASTLLGDNLYIVMGEMYVDPFVSTSVYSDGILRFNVPSRTMFYHSANDTAPGGVGTGPGARADTTLMEGKDGFWILGGVDPGGSILTDIWYYNATSATWTVPSGSTTVYSATRPQFYRVGDATDTGGEWVLWGGLDTGGAPVADYCWVTLEESVVGSAVALNCSTYDPVSSIWFGGMTRIFYQDALSTYMFGLDDSGNNIQGFSEYAVTMIVDKYAQAIDDINLTSMIDSPDWPGVRDYVGAMTVVPAGSTLVIGGVGGAGIPTETKGWIATSRCTGFDDPYIQLCAPCPLGYDSDGVECRDCPGGMSSTWRGSDCVICPAGSEVIDQVCLQCPYGTANPDSSGFGICDGCELGTYSNITGLAECEACPDNQVTYIEGATSLTDCLCSTDFYSVEKTLGALDCVACSAGAVCDGGLAEPVAAPGFWNDPLDPYTFYACAYPEACSGGAAAACQDGYEGRMCGVCSDNHYPLGSGECMQCPDGPWLNAVLIGLALCVVSYLFFWLGGSGVQFGVFSVVLGFLQTTAILVNYELSWPSEIQALFTALEAVNFSAEVASPECMGKVDYIHKLVAQLAIPVVAVVALFFGFIGKIIKTRRNPDPAIAGTTIADIAGNFVNIGMVLFSVLYVMLADKSVELFDCTEQEDGTWTFDKAPQYNCYDGKWLEWQPIAIAAVCLYIIGVPLGVSAVLWFAKKKMTPERFRAYFSKITQRYEDQWFMWEPVVMIRKLIFVLIPVVVKTDVLFQTVFGIFGFMFALLTQTYARPYDDDLVDLLETVLIGVDLLILFSGLLFYSGKIPSDALDAVTNTVTGFFGLALLIIAVFSIREFNIQMTNYKAFKAAKAAAQDAGASVQQASMAAAASIENFAHMATPTIVSDSVAVAAAAAGAAAAVYAGAEVTQGMKAVQKAKLSIKTRAKGKQEPEEVLLLQEPNDVVESLWSLAVSTRLGVDSAETEGEGGSSSTLRDAILSPRAASKQAKAAKIPAELQDHKARLTKYLKSLPPAEIERFREMFGVAPSAPSLPADSGTIAGPSTAPTAPPASSPIPGAVVDTEPPVPAASTPAAAAGPVQSVHPPRSPIRAAPAVSAVAAADLIRDASASTGNAAAAQPPAPPLEPPPSSEVPKAWGAPQHDKSA